MSWNPEDVVSSPEAAMPNLQKTLALSGELEAVIWDLLDPPNYLLGYDEPRMIASFEACQLAMEHGQAVSALIRDSSSCFVMAAALLDLMVNDDRRGTLSRSRVSKSLRFRYAWQQGREGKIGLMRRSCV